MESWSSELTRSELDFLFRGGKKNRIRRNFVCVVGPEKTLICSCNSSKIVIEALNHSFKLSWCSSLAVLYGVAVECDPKSRKIKCLDGKKRNCHLKRRSERYKLWMNGEWLWRSFTSPNSRATIYFILFLFLSLIVVGSSLSIRIQIIITHEREEKSPRNYFSS